MEGFDKEICLHILICEHSYKKAKAKLDSQDSEIKKIKEMYESSSSVFSLFNEN